MILAFMFAYYEKTEAPNAHLRIAGLLQASSINMKFKSNGRCSQQGQCDQKALLWKMKCGIRRGSSLHQHTIERRASRLRGQKAIMLPADVTKAIVVQKITIGLALRSLPSRLHRYCKQDPGTDHVMISESAETLQGRSLDLAFGVAIDVSKPIVSIKLFRNV